MTTATIQYNSIDELIEHAQAEWDHALNKMPTEVLDELCFRPRWALQVFDYLHENQQQDKKELEVAFAVLGECLDQARYRIDRGDSEGQKILDDIKQAGDPIVSKLPTMLRMEINQVIFDTKVPLKFSKGNEANDDKSNALPRIQPQLPELLESLRRESGFKTAFELTELLLPHIQQLPTEDQLSIVAELAHSKKSLARESAILMLLHPEQEVRSQVADLLYTLSDKKLFTPIDLRRLIVLRNWVPVEERQPIDLLIQQLKKNKLQSAPYFQTKPSRISASIVDGAGAGLILFETKRLKERIVGGVLFKIGVGIKDAWTMKKATKHCFDDIVERSSENGTEFRPTSRKYVNSLIQHFLYEAISYKNVPSATLLELAEAVGGDKWQPNKLDLSSAVQSLVETVSEDYTSEQLTEKALNSSSWNWDVSLCDHWFETGPIVQQAAEEAIEQHKQDPSLPLNKITTRCLMDRCLEKWKLVFLMAALWQKSSSKSGAFIELVSVLEALNRDIAPEDIPVIEKIVGKSVAGMVQRNRSI